MEKKFATVLRTWSNNADITKSVKRALEVGAGLVIIVVKDDDPMHFGCVEAWLEGQINANSGRIVILPMRFGYTWSNALNYAFDEIRRHNLVAAVKGESRFEFVLNVSNEVLYTREDVEAMLVEIQKDEKLAVVGTSFQGRKSGNPVELGKSYIHPRNTMMLVRFSAYQAIGGYSPRCDQLGGQEDLDWLIRLEQAGLRWSMLDRRIALLVGVNFDQPTKEKRELKAIVDIMSMNAEISFAFSKALQRLY
ncbi:MAG: hypothetical protein ABIB04_00875 [Patescibacteria group bacterium]